MRIITFTRKDLADDYRNHAVLLYSNHPFLFETMQYYCQTFENFIDLILQEKISNPSGDLLLVDFWSEKNKVINLRLFNDPKDEDYPNEITKFLINHLEESEVSHLHIMLHQLPIQIKVCIDTPQPEIL